MLADWRPVMRHAHQTAHLRPDWQRFMHWRARIRANAGRLAAGDASRASGGDAGDALVPIDRYPIICR
jgi:hypothetical protein